MTRLTIGVFGNGAAGGYFGGRLAEAGEDVRFIARGAHLAALSGVGAISRVPVGVIRTQPETRRLLREALEEIYGLALHAGIALPTDTVERTLAFIDGLRAEGTTSLSATC